MAFRQCVLVTVVWSAHRQACGNNVAHFSLTSCHGFSPLSAFFSYSLPSLLVTLFWVSLDLKWQSPPSPATVRLRVWTWTTAVRLISRRLFTFQCIPDIPQPGAEGSRSPLINSHRCHRVLGCVPSFLTPPARAASRNKFSFNPDTSPASLATERFGFLS